jgi:TnpA family transposase
MPVEFLTDEEAAAYGAYQGVPSQAEMEKLFFLDAADRRLVARRRGDHNRLGFAMQLTTVRYLGLFLPDPLAVPGEVVGYLAGQLKIADPGCVGRYTKRRNTKFEHAEEIKAEFGLHDFEEREKELRDWVDARAWTTGDGPKAIFADAVRWLREHDVLLPGVTTLARLVAQVRDEANQRLWETLDGLLTAEQRVLLDSLTKVPEGERVSQLEKWRKGPVKASGRTMERALDRVSEIRGTGFGRMGLEEVVPSRRLVDMARYGMSAKSQQISRHPQARRLATLLATVVYLEGKATDDALELLDLLMTTDLLGKAERESEKDKARRHPRLARASAKLAVAVEVLFEAAGWGEEVTLERVWEGIEAVISRAELREAVAAVTDMVPPPDADVDGEMRAKLAARIVTVSGFLKMLTEVIVFGATEDGAAVLAAMKALPRLLDGRRRRGLTAADVNADLVRGSWRPLVFPGAGKVDKNAYVFCVLTQFHAMLRRRDIYAEASGRWRDPRGQLLDGPAWAAAKEAVLTALGLPEDPDALLAGHVELLDATYRGVAGRFAANEAVSLDAEGRVHVARITAENEPKSLLDLRARVEAMMPRVDLPEVILEVMSWEPGFGAAFTPVSGGRSRLRMKDLDITIAACLTAHALNIGYGPVVKKGAEALERDRIGHVDLNYLRPETYAAANSPLIGRQATIALAQAWGGGHVASVDGMRFVVAVPSLHARPNRKYFGPKRGATWLNMINDQAAGIGAKVLSGTPRDSLHLIDVLYAQDGGQRPDIVVTDAGSYSDLVFGLVHLFGTQYRPQLADLPDHKLWRIDQRADYGPLNTAARGKIDLSRIRRWWPDILRVTASIHTGTVRAYDVIRMLQRDGHPTPLGEAIAMYGRIFKSLHVLTFCDAETYRREIKAQTNLSEGRHDLGRVVFHGHKGELYQRYHAGMEEQLGALGLVLNCIVLWNTFYMNETLGQLRAESYPVRDQDVERLSPFIRKHLGVHGRYSFVLPDLGGGIRALRDPDVQDDDFGE